jgi:hypothetical protein
MLTPMSDAAQGVLDSLEPDNVEGYTVAFGNAFSGLRCEGFFETLEEAFAYSERVNDDYGNTSIVTVWKPR